MTSELRALCLDADDPERVARFWGALLAWGLADDVEDGAVELVPTEPTGFRLRFEPARGPRVVRDRLHLHLTSTSPEDQQATVRRAVELGARHLDVGQLPEEGHVVLADPEGNELCVLPPGNVFLAGGGFLAEVTCDGSRAVGRFWSEALGWPLVWDQDDETSIRRHGGSTNISWGGPPVEPKVGRNRQHLELLVTAGDLLSEVDRLVALGASRLDAGQDPGPHGRVLLADPDGNELTLLAGATG